MPTRTQDELQYSEHVLKMLREHKELIDIITGENKQGLIAYLEFLRDYAKNLREVQISLGNSVKHIYSSVQEMGRINGTTQNIGQFVAAFEKLDKVLTDEAVAKVLKVIKE